MFSLPDSLSVGDLDTFHHAFQEHGHRALEWRRRIIDFELDLELHFELDQKVNTLTHQIKQTFNLALTMNELFCPLP